MSATSSKFGFRKFSICPSSNMGHGLGVWSRKIHISKKGFEGEIHDASSNTVPRSNAGIQVPSSLLWNLEIKYLRDQSAMVEWIFWLCHSECSLQSLSWQRRRFLLGGSSYFLSHGMTSLTLNDRLSRWSSVKFYKIGVWPRGKYCAMWSWSTPLNIRDGHQQWHRQMLDSQGCQLH